MDWRTRKICHHLFNVDYSAKNCEDYLGFEISVSVRFHLIKEGKMGETDS